MVECELTPWDCNCPLTSVEDLVAPEVEDVPGALPLVQGRWELRGRDVQVDRHQRDADQAHMKPPLSHVELSGGAVSFLPRKVTFPKQKGAICTPVQGASGKLARTELILVIRLKVSELAKWLIWKERAAKS